MTGRHAITREAALTALDTPAGRGLIAAMAFGTAFGVALPAANATEQTSDKKVAGILSVSQTEAPTVSSTEAVTAPEDAEWGVTQVSVNEGRGVEVSATVTIPEPEPEPAPVAPAAAPAAEEAPAPAVEEQPVTDVSASDSYQTTSEVAAPAAPVEAAPAPSGAGSSVLATALAYQGSPYVWGGTTPSGWDCIGFVRYVYAQHGVSIGGYTTSVLEVGRQVSYSEVQPGDILYWPGHVAIYSGDGMNVGAWNPDMGTTTGPNSWLGTPTVIRVFG
ncbi:MAG: C40 family peptidase [Ancrocorticia sp.]